MKRFLSAVCLCVFLLGAGVFFLLPSTGAQNNVLQDLLNLPAPPPPNPLVDNRFRDARFFAKNNPPKDDAPIDDLMEYWRAQNQYNPKFAFTAEPSDKSLSRLMSELEKNPEDLINFLNVLSQKPDAADFVKRLYDRKLNDRKFEESWRETVKDWLTYNSKYYSDELLDLARAATDTAEYVTNQNEVLALARVDWDKARPILERMLGDSSQPVSQTLARWAFYEHALREGDTGDIDKYRKELQETVEDKNAKPGNRDLAMDALVEAGDFAGRDEWYFSLLEDETLFDLRVNGASYTSLTTLLNHSPSEKYVEKMLELIKSDNQAVRNAAARNLGTLLDEKNPEIIKALLPWLENPKWAQEVGSERHSLVQALALFQIPESVPGLIAVLNESEKKEIPKYGNSNVAVASNTMVYTTNSNTPYPRIQTESFPFRITAVSALAKQKDSRAAPALRAILMQVDDYQRPNVVNALLMSNGFSIPEQIDALETTVKNIDKANSVMPSNMKPYSGNMTKMDEDEPALISVNSSPMMVNVNSVRNISGFSLQRPVDPNDIKAILGNQIINNSEPTAAFITALIDRIGVLEGKDAKLANALRTVMMNWRGDAINSLFLRDLKNGKAGTDIIVRLLSVRKQLREKQISEVFALRGGNPTVLGIAACLLEDTGDYGAILSSANIESKIALLGCARLIRAPLSVGQVAENLKSPNKMLARAAELYLESEDSPEARQIVLALHPDEAKILGARVSFSNEDTIVIDSYTAELFSSVSDSFAFNSYYFTGSYFGELDDIERSLQKEVKENQELLGVYAYNGNAVRIYKDKAVFSRKENAARYRERDLTKEEFENFKYYLASQRVDELAPFLTACNECIERELLMLGRGGGRRIFVKAERMPQFFAGLDEMFDELQKSPARLRYELERDIAGLEILFADDILQARAVWKSGDDLRVLIDDTERRKRIDKELDLLDENDQVDEDADYEKIEAARQKRRAQRKYENFSWFKLREGKLGDFASQPPQIEYLPARDSFRAQAETGGWKSRAVGVEIRADEEGLYKLSRGAFTKIRAGYYAKPVVTPDGRWVIVTKYDEEGDIIPFRVNLLTNKEFKIALPDYPIVEAVAFVPSINKMLLFAGTYYEDESERDGSYFLLDAETGVAQPAKGVVQPLLQQTIRPLQPAVGADEFWAAIPDADDNQTLFGIYNTKTLSFKTLLEIPQITFDSMEMWVDGGKVYFVYEGHVLSLPIPKG